MKIALLGSAPSSIGRAPFKNSNYQAWLEGKDEMLARAHGDVPGDFDLWGCSPGCWAVSPRATRWFEVHRWEPHQHWFSPEYVRFLREFKGPVYVGGKVPEVPNAVIYPIDRMEEKFSSYFMTSSLALMMALAIDTIEHIRAQRRLYRENKVAQDAGVPVPVHGLAAPANMPVAQFEAELAKGDDDDIIGMWGVDMAAYEEYGYQRPGCQFFILEAMRRGIAVYLPPESDLMRPMPVYGISEWDHNYIKLTTRSRELNMKATEAAAQAREAEKLMIQAQAEMGALNHFVNTWTSPYGMQHGLVIRQEPGTGLGSGITHYDGRPVTRMTVAEDQKLPPPAAMVEPPEAQLGREVTTILLPHVTGSDAGAVGVLRRIIQERDDAILKLGKAQIDVELLKRKRKPAKVARRR